MRVPDGVIAGSYIAGSYFEFEIDHNIQAPWAGHIVKEAKAMTDSPAARRPPASEDRYLVDLNAISPEVLARHIKATWGISHRAQLMQYLSVAEEHWPAIKRGYTMLPVQAATPTTESFDDALVKFSALCRKHDYWYSRSDDATVWRKGEAEATEMQRLALIIGQDRADEIFARYRDGGGE